MREARQCQSLERRLLLIMLVHCSSCLCFNVLAPEVVCEGRRTGEVVVVTSTKPSQRLPIFSSPDYDSSDVYSNLHTIASRDGVSVGREAAWVDQWVDASKTRDATALHAPEGVGRAEHHGRSQKSLSNLHCLIVSLFLRKGIVVVDKVKGGERERVGVDGCRGWRGWRKIRGAGLLFTGGRRACEAATGVFSRYCRYPLFIHHNAKPQLQFPDYGNCDIALKLLLCLYSEQ